ncbi:MAG: L,D-transpeptidase family protein [Caulobacter sp.]|nr:L,D-transpeptidase family protein [Caulobacter sp.]
MVAAGTAGRVPRLASFGIHGSDRPREISKTFSHGCVRLTDWDAEQLAAGVKPGVVVTFVG